MWPHTRLGQRDLALMCAPRTVYPVEYHVQNELYGFAGLLREYAGLPAEEPLPWAMEHAIRFDHPTPHPADVESTLPLRLTISEGQAAVLSRSVSVPVLPVGSAYFYMRALNDREADSGPPDEDRRGTLVFPDKSTEDLDTEFDRDRFAADLAALPRAFHPVTVSVYWKDYQKGHHRPYEKMGLGLVSSGHPYDPMFLFRLLDLCRQFRYACANDLSSSFCFSVLTGCRFFYWPTGPVEMTQDGVTRVYERDPTLSLPTKQACLAASPFPPAGHGAAQRRLAEQFAGLAWVRPPGFFRELRLQGRRLLAKSPSPPVSFNRVTRRDQLAPWLLWGVDSDGWARSRCGFSLPHWRRCAAVRLKIEVPPRPSPTWTGILSIARGDGAARRYQLSVGYWEVLVPSGSGDLTLGCDSEILLDSLGRHRAFRLLDLETVEWSPRLLAVRFGGRPEPIVQRI